MPEKLEQEVNRLRSEVAALQELLDVQERTVLEQSQRLEAARREALASAEAKAQFLANMSHEIRTPMNAVIGMTSLLLDTHLDATQREYVETVRLSGEHLLALINDILDFSKIESGKLALEEREFSLRTCIEDAMELIAARAGSKGVDLAYDWGEGVPALLVGDGDRLRQVLVNLLGNAVKFTERGEVVLSVRAAPREGDLWEWTFRVRDTGIGIPKDRRDRLFQTFSQVDVSTTRQYGGTGLGLAICKRLVELMGGTIGVESEPGRGSTFSFTILGRPGSSSGTSKYTRHNVVEDLRVLIVDDNATNRHILTRQTLAWRMIPRAAASGIEALEILKREAPFQLAILDHQMPGMDGLSLAREIRQAHPREPILVLATSSGALEPGQAAAAGFAGTLTKPIRQSQLLDRLVGILGSRSVPVRASSEVVERDLAVRVPLRILVAEDNPVNQRVVVLMLGKMGYRPDVVAAGGEAVAAVRRQVYDVVLMDVQMPELDGREATRLIRDSSDVVKQPHVIGLTAEALPGDREQCLAAGMDDYLSKPVRPVELAAALCRVGGPHAGAQAPASHPEPEAGAPVSVRPAELDPQALATLRDLTATPEGFADLVDQQISESVRLVGELKEAIAGRDFPTARRFAHSLKSSAQLFGDGELARACADLEAATAAETEGAIALLAGVKRANEASVAALQALRAGGRS